MKQIPAWVVSLLPVAITRKGAIELEVIDDMQYTIANGGSFAGYASKLQQMRMASFHKMHHSYMSAAVLTANLHKLNDPKQSSIFSNPPPPTPFHSCMVR